MLFDYFDNGTFYKDIINSIEDNRKDIEQDNKKKIRSLDNKMTAGSNNQGGIRQGRIVQAQEKKQ